MDELTGPPRARLDVTDQPGGAGLVIGIGGELDIAGLRDVTPKLDELLGRAPTPVCLNLAELDFLDSSGVSMLVRIANHFGRVQTLDATEPVRRVLEILGLSDLLGLNELSDGNGD